MFAVASRSIAPSTAPKSARAAIGLTMVQSEPFFDELERGLAGPRR